jgi:hypothetical protein
MGYQYALHQHKMKLREERDVFMRSQDTNSMTSNELWDDHSDDSEYSREREKKVLKAQQKDNGAKERRKYSRSLIP